MLKKLCYTQLITQDHIFLCLPLFLGVGIGGYFAWPHEPSYHILSYMLGGFMIITLLSLFKYADYFPFLLLITAIIFGGWLGSFRTQYVSTPVLQWRYYGPVEGKIVAIDQSNRGKWRIMLDKVRLNGFQKTTVPKYIRVSFEDEALIFTDLKVGAYVTTTANLSPPGYPTEPGEFDFRRHAWFMQLGAVGYSRVALLRADDRGKISALNVTRDHIRRRIAKGVNSSMSKDVAGFALAILYGDKAHLDPVQLEHLRRSNLAHLLAISGLHMGLLIGFTMTVGRMFLALFPSISGRWNNKKIMAVIAIFAGGFYLWLSGASIATERAFIMVTVMLVGVLLDRPAITMRAIAIAALIILIRKPESIFSVGFQMSFAATTALVFVFGHLSRASTDRSQRSKFLKGVISMGQASLIAGLATAPFSAATFNQFSQIGLPANLLAVPMMSFIVMPAGIVGILLEPFGMSEPAYILMSWGIRWIMAVANWMSELPISVRYISPANWSVIPCLTMGVFMVVLAVKWVRILGISLIIFSAIQWSMATRPDFLISDTGSIIGILTVNGRALSKEKGSGYFATQWLKNDADGLDQIAGAKLWKGRELEVGYEMSLIKGEKLFIIHKKLTGRANYQEICKEYFAVIDLKAELTQKHSCPIITAKNLKRTGALAYWGKTKKWTMARPKEINQRLWQ